MFSIKQLKIEDTNFIHELRLLISPVLIRVIKVVHNYCAHSTTHYFINFFRLPDK